MIYGSWQGYAVGIHDNLDELRRESSIIPAVGASRITGCGG